MKKQPLKKNKEAGKLLVVGERKDNRKGDRETDDETDAKSPSSVRIVGKGRSKIGQKVTTTHRSSSEDDVTRLIAKKRLHSESMTHQPHVKDLLTAQDFGVDAEAVWGSEAENSASTSGHWRWGGGILIIAILVAVGFMVTSFKLMNFISVDETLAVEESANVSKLPKVVTTKEDLMSDVENIKRCLDGYLSADTIAEKLKYVRNAKVMEPKMTDHYSRFALRPLGNYKLRNQTGSMFGAKALTRVKLELASGGFKGMLLEQSADGSYLVDWESEACYLPVDWDVFLGKQPTDAGAQEEKLFTEPLAMRVYVEVASSFLYEYSDDDEYDSYRLRTQNQAGVIDAYVKKNSDVGMALAHTMNLTVSVGETSLRPLMLGLITTKRGDGKTVAIIDEVISRNWVHINDDDESK